MIMTILEARVPSEKWVSLELAYKESIRHVPTQLRESYLIHSINTPSMWRIVSLWRNLVDYEEASRGGKAEVCMQIFHSIGVEPTRRVFDVPAHFVQI
jgi:hypothetical protein